MEITEYKTLQESQKIEVAKNIAMHSFYDYYTVKHTLDDAAAAYDLLLDWRRVTLTVITAESLLNIFYKP